MAEQKFEKILTANDIGATGAHQAGIHVPKSQTDLIRFLPPLNPKTKNPDAWLTCIDDAGEIWSFRYIHYNNRLHDPKGTRDEYRITHMTKFFRTVGAGEGDVFSITARARDGRYQIRVTPPALPVTQAGDAVRIRLQGWRRVH